MTKQFVNIAKVDGNGVGVGYIDGKPILVPYALTGETIELCKVEDMGKYSLCTEFCIVQQSKDRIEPKCKYFGKCGGCQLQHMSADSQRQLKTAKVLDNLKYIAGIEVKCDKYFEADGDYNYRNKMVYVVDCGRCGMYEPKSHRFVEIEQCEISSTGLNNFYSVVRQWVAESKPPINHIAIREVAGKYLCVLISTTKCDVAELVAMLDKKFDGKYQLYININDGVKQLITSNLIRVAGDNIIDNSMAFNYPVSPNSFLQVNSEISNKLYNAVLDEVDREIVINAYSGAGYLSAMLSMRASKVYGVELVANAHKDAENLRQSNNLKNIINYCGKAEEIVPKIMADVDKATLVVDPPRSGVADSLLKVINNSNKIDKLVYISCDSLSLAKNLRMLSNYEIVSLKLADMFPQTIHVETLVVMRRKENYKK